MQFFAEHYNYWISIVLMMIGFYSVIAKSNLVKKAIGLGLFQTGIFLFYVSIGKVSDGTAPVRVIGENASEAVYSNPLPHALILTAIVVSVSTLAVAMAIIINVKEQYGTIDDEDIESIEDREDQEAAGG
ncbi:cation:proton antiporter subunit C [Planctomycetota bacterium]|nr:cation:proton antiporter subunit C [Planctomycetota bacterium]